jgi:hypothetical protein
MPVEFIGGPYDGHYQETPDSPADQIVLQVSLDIFARLNGATGWGAPVTSLAVYEFDPGQEAYRFVRQLSP